MVWVVFEKQDMTASDAIFRGRNTTRTLNEYVFETEQEAINFQNSRKSMLRFAGLAGQYYTYPQEFETFTVHTHTCDHCDKRFSLESDSDLGFTDLGGDYCSRQCFRNAYQESRNPPQFDEQYDENY